MRIIARQGARLAAALFLAASTASVAAAEAAKTPSHVFQEVGRLGHQVDALLAADFITLAARPEAPKPSDRRPRHVFAMLVALADQVAVLRRLNGLDAAPALMLPPKIITPSDVFAGVKTMQGSLDGLLAHYGTAPGAFTEALGANKTPADVYARLKAVSGRLAQADLPPTAPNEVYRFAETLHLETEALAARLGAPPAPPLGAASGKTPRDVFMAVIDYAKALAHLAETRPAIAPSGRLFAPALPNGRVTPAAVRGAIKLVLADLIEMRVKAGLTTPLAAPEPPVGKTPSHVFARLEAARAALAGAPLSSRAAAD